MKKRKMIDNATKLRIAEEYLNGNESQLQVAARNQITVVTLLRIIKKYEAGELTNEVAK